MTAILKKRVLPNLPYALVFWFANKLGEAYRLAEGGNFLGKVTGSMATLNTAISRSLLSLSLFDLCVGLAGAALIYLVVAQKKKNAKKWRKDVEYGSARWGTPEDIAPFMDKKPDNNIILKLVTTFISNTKGDGKSSDPFWEKSEPLLFTALIAYLYYESPEHECNFSTLAEMIGAMEVREEDEEFKNIVDIMFDALAEKDPEHFAVRQYSKYKLAAGAACQKRQIGADSARAIYV